MHMFTAKTPQISSRILNLISEIDTFKGEWTGSKLLNPSILSTMQTTAKFESIGEGKTKRFNRKRDNQKTW